MSLIKCQECGKEFSDKALSCPNCGCPNQGTSAPENAIMTDPASRYRNTNSDREKPKKESGLGLAALICSILGCTLFIGVILAIIDLVKKDKSKKHTYSKVALVIAAIWIILSLIFGAANSSTPSTNPAESAAVQTNQEQSEPKEVKAAPSEAADTDIPSEKPAVADEKDDTIPREYKSALNKAKTYSELMNMSKAAIYEQLTSDYGEQFTAEAAQYAIDNMEADWNANALAKAQTYSDTMHMSKSGTYDQLVSEYGEQFTAEEAQYAVDNVHADWNANALEKAKTYQESMDMSPSAIHDQLTSEYGEKFTQEEADYAIANLN